MADEGSQPVPLAEIGLPDPPKLEHTQARAFFAPGGGYELVIRREFSASGFLTKRTARTPEAGRLLDYLLARLDQKFPLPPDTVRSWKQRALAAEMLLEALAPFNLAAQVTLDANRRTQT